MYQRNQKLSHKKPTKEQKPLNRRRKVKNYLQRNQLKPNQKKKYQDELMITIEKKLQETYRKITLENESCAKAKKNSKFFFNYTKRFNKIKTTVGPLLKKDGVHYGQWTMKTWQKYFQNSTQTSSANQKPPFLNQLIFSRQNEEKRTIIDNVFNERDIEEFIDEIVSTAATGPEGFSAIFILITCKKIRSKPLLILW